MKKTIEFAFFLFASILTATSGLKAEAPRIQKSYPDVPTYTTPTITPNRSIFLNGIDISSARNQDLRNVHLKISENGDIYIAAPQYQVNEEETFMPLSSYSTKKMPPEHMRPQLLPDPSNAQPTKSAENSDKPTPEKASPAPTQPASVAAPKAGG